MSKSYDLSTSSKWSALSDGEHTVQIVAKGTGYRDSERSSAVVVTKATTPTEDELAGTWVFNNTIDASYILNIDVSFICDGKQGSNIWTDEGWLNMSGIKSPVYTESGWVNEVYKTITITSKLSEVTNGDMLLTWLQANATKQ